MSILTQVEYIDPFPIGHATTGPPMYATAKGILRILADHKHHIRVPMYYCAQASGTIISPDAICSSLDNSYYKFGLESNLITGHGTMTFESPENTTHTVTTVRHNGLWFLSQNVIYSTLLH